MVATWNTIPNFIDGINVPDADDLNEFLENTRFIHTAGINELVYGDGSGDYTATASVFTDIGAPFSVTKTFLTGTVMVVFRGDVYSSSANPMYMAIALDGTPISNMSNGYVISRAANHNRAGFIVRFFDILSGMQTVSMQWKRDSSGTMTLENSGGRVPLFYVRQISWTP